MALADHAFVLLIAVIYPAIGYLGFRRLLRRVAAGETIDRSGLYRNTFIGHWLLFFLGGVLWAASGRDWTALGFRFEANAGFLLAAVLTVAGTAVLALQLRQAKAASAADIAAARAKLADISLMIPRTPRETARFNALSVTAGIVEETLWRGYLIWYLVQFMPLWAAALATSAGFGIAHAYQGARHVPQIALVGAVFAGLFVLSGSLWLPMIFHALVDILQGRLAHVVFSREAQTDGGAAPAGISASSRR